MPKFHSVFLKFTAILIPSVFISLVIILTIYERVNYHQKISELGVKLETLAASQSIILAEAVANKNHRIIRLAIATIITDPDIGGVALEDLDGNSLDSYGITINDPACIEKTLSINYANDVAIHKVGTLSLCGTNKKIIKDLTTRVKYESLLAIILLIVVFIGAYFAQRHSVGIALGKLYDSIKSKNDINDVSIVEWNSNDEIGRVISSFNELQKNLKNRDQQLETRVKDRTEELELEIKAKGIINSKLEESETRHRAILETMADAHITTTKTGVLESWNPSAAEIFGHTSEEMLGQNISKLLSEDDCKEYISRIEIFTNNNNPDSLENSWKASARKKDGGIVPVLINTRAMKFEGEHLFNTHISDITDLHHLTERLSFQASHDSLTGLINRREFEHRLDRTLATARETNSEHALCYIDLDQFKVINDTCGHEAGDQLLSQLGQTLLKQIRQRDTLGRLGGDEFGLLMEHCNLQQALKVTEKIRETISSFLFSYDNHSFKIGASIGLVSISDKSINSTEILKKADVACYMAKDMGRNRIHVHSEDDAELAKQQGEMQWVSVINDTLENDQFQLYYQTIEASNYSNEQKLHYEVLLRMFDEDNQIIAPGQFLPAAERYNLTPMIDRYVINKTFSWLSKHPEHVENLEFCSINLSAHSITDKSVFDFIVKQFEKTKLDPEKICFEITETAVISRLSLAVHFITDLKKIGCRFALDDFGSGLSSFAYLRNLPVDFLKIDGQFIREISNSEIDHSIVKSMNDIGHIMGKQTIAEFVEDYKILNMLKILNVDYVQGYQLGKPRPIDELLET